MRSDTSLRAGLRAETEVAHASLDECMRQVGWHDRASYGRFLQMQYAARLPVENWAHARCPADIRPPCQSPLIERDLAALELEPVSQQSHFRLPEGADPIGLAWAIGGSSLGNRSILHDMRRSAVRADEDASLPTAFLEDEAMTAFWQSLRSRLDREAAPEDLRAAALAAKAVFEHFQSTIGAMTPNGIAQ